MLGSLPPFDYHRPSTLEEALHLMRRFDGNVSLYAGGTELLVALKDGRLRPHALADIKHIPELGVISPEDGGLRLGATLTARAISRSAVAKERCPLLSQAVQTLGSMQIGNRATLGGNLCNGSPAADSAPALLALQASVKLVGVERERWVSLEDFFVGPGKTVLDREILAEIRIPSPLRRGQGVFYKLGSRGAPEDICIVSVAAFAVPDASGKSWQDVRVALGAVAPTPVRARHAEASLRGQPIGPQTAHEAARLAAEKDAQPITDIRGSAGYRRAMVRVLVRRALEQVARDAGEEATL